MGYRRPWVIPVTKHSWAVRWYVPKPGGGRRQCFEGGFPTKKLAQKARRVIEERINAGLMGVNPLESTPWVELIAAHGVSLTHARPATRRMYAQILKGFGEHAKHPEPRNISQHTCEAFMASIVGVSDETLRKYHRVLHAFFAWCVGAGFMPANPMDNVRKPPKTRRRKRVPTTDDCVKLFEALPDAGVDDANGWHVLLLLALVTGLRRSDLLLLTPRNFRLGVREGIGLLEAETTKDRDFGTWGLPRIVNDRVAQRIAILPSGEGRLFLWSCWPRKAWERVRKAAGFAYPFHSLRAAAGILVVLDRLKREGAHHLLHSDTHTFDEHYADGEQIALATAEHLELPELPAPPAFSLEPIPGKPGRRSLGS